MPARSRNFRLSIETVNAAFDEGRAPYEVARILRDLADRIESRACLPVFVPLYDVNGNRVGEAKAGGR